MSNLMNQSLKNRTLMGMVREVETARLEASNANDGTANGLNTSTTVGVQPRDVVVQGGKVEHVANDNKQPTPAGERTIPALANSAGELLRLRPHPQSLPRRT